MSWITGPTNKSPSSRACAPRTQLKWTSVRLASVVDVYRVLAADLIRLGEGIAVLRPVVDVDIGTWIRVEARIANRLTSPRHGCLECVPDIPFVVRAKKKKKTLHGSPQPYHYTWSES